MHTKINITGQADAENSTELSEETLSQITAGAIDAFIFFGDYNGGYIKGETTD